ncbi:hypothetical protein DFH27DRAFT_287579 [Peziza echinospora]|nr:hypothetical protein DFH27DRAFT_287579 [Peziza echinospora]
MFYPTNLLALVCTCSILCWKQVQVSSAQKGTLAGSGDGREIDGIRSGGINEIVVDAHAVEMEIEKKRMREVAYAFVRSYVIVYVLVWAADWLQGPHIYALYKDEKEFSEKMVALFFMCGFLAAGVSAGVVGMLADRFGRKFMCMLFCVAYATSCWATTYFTSPLLLIGGRILGGVSTSILYSAPESWMVTEWAERGLGVSEELGGVSLSYLFGVLTQVNSVTAIGMGIFSEWLVEGTGTLKTPFLVAMGLLGVAGCVIAVTWTENRGTVSQLSPWADVKSAMRIILDDSRVSAIGLSCCFFEGSMYLFVFFWTPSLQDASGRGSTALLTGSSSPHFTPTTPLPYGIIFASFMASMMAGSLIFNHLITKTKLDQIRILPYVFAVASAMFVVSIWFGRHEWVVFWAWCVFEACVGCYYPCVGYLKGVLVPSGQRAAVYALMRIPLNVFVVAAFAVMQRREKVEGADAKYRNSVFSICAVLLAAGGVLTAVYVRSLQPRALRSTLGARGLQHAARYCSMD